MHRYVRHGMATSNVRQHILGRATRTAPGGAALVRMRRAAVIWAHTTCARTECGCKVRAFGLCMQANVDNRAACSSCREGCLAGAQATARLTDMQLGHTPRVHTRLRVGYARRINRSRSKSAASSFQVEHRSYICPGTGLTITHSPRNRDRALCARLGSLCARGCPPCKKSW